MWSRLATPPDTATGEPMSVPLSWNCTEPVALLGATFAVSVTDVPVSAVAGAVSVVVVDSCAATTLMVASGPAPALRGAVLLSLGVHRVGAHCVPRKLALANEVLNDS